MGRRTALAQLREGAAIYTKVVNAMEQRIYTGGEPPPFTTKQFYAACWRPDEWAAMELISKRFPEAIQKTDSGQFLMVDGSRKLSFRMEFGAGKRELPWPQGSWYSYWEITGRINSEFWARHRQWARAHADRRWQHSRTVAMMDRVFNTLSNTHQLVRVWPDLGRVFHHLPKYSAKTRLPNVCYESGSGGGLHPDWRPNAFAETGDLIAEALMLPPLDDPKRRGIQIEYVS